MNSQLDDWLGRIEQSHPSTIELGLDRCREVWERMDRPRPGNRIITVAGTNGKGSTVAGIESALRFLDRRVGSYTSPHLVRYNERIRVGGREADDQAIIEGLEAVDAAVGETRLTYFEFVTLGAFATLSRHGLDDAVLEIGLGGRLDAVNLVDPDIAVITPIGLDHQDYLGNDRESIAREKAGIMRPGQTVVCGDREPPEAIFSEADRLGVRLIRIGADFDVCRGASDSDPAAWRYYYSDLEAEMPIAMAGNHQGDNLAAALTAALLAEPRARANIDGLAHAVAASRVRGRLERVAEQPEVIVDVGHNPLAAVAIRDYLEGRGVSACRAVLGMLKDKDAESVVKILADRVDEWYCAGLAGARGQSGEQLAGRLRGAIPRARVRSYPAVALALDAAMEDAARQGLIMVFGSFHTAAEAIVHHQGLNC